MPERTLVTGGTGLLGDAVVRRLLTAGNQVRVMSRSERPSGDTAAYEWAGADPRSGDGLAEAMADVDTLVHCANATSKEKERALVAAVTEAAKRAGVGHFLYVSIVGVDRIPLGYYQGKLAAERSLENSGLPYTILRATQFHDLVRAILAVVAKFPVLPAPGIGFQPVDVGEVASRLVELAAGEPAGRVADFGGPQVRNLRDLARSYLAATDRRRILVPVRLPGKVFGGFRAGANLAPEQARGEITFERYLAEHPAPKRTSYRVGVR